jgi:DNA gyrase subunit A
LQQKKDSRSDLKKLISAKWDETQPVFAPSNLEKSDEVISADIVAKDAKNPVLFVMGSNGYGKKTKLSEYKTQNRGGSGILTMNVTAKTGPLMAAKVMTDDNEEIVAMSKKSQVIRVDTKKFQLLADQLRVCAS